MDNTVQEAKKSLLFKSLLHKSAAAAAIICSIIAMGLLVAIYSGIYSTQQFIGWGITLGVPITFGVYLGVFAVFGSFWSKSDINKKVKQRNIGSFLKWFFVLLIGFFLLSCGFFILSAFVLLDYGTVINTEYIKGAATTGLFCSLMLTGIFVLPVLVTVFALYFLGLFLRKLAIKRISKKFLILLYILGLGIPSMFDRAERIYGERSHLPDEKIVTVRTVGGSIHEVWKQIQFYEDTGSEAPLLFAIGFPKPLRTEGDIHKVGGFTKCVYNKGYLIKKITQSEISNKQAYLSFDVIEQVNIEDRAVQLKSGSFTMVAKDQGAVSLKLETSYKPLMTPRWMWRPLEVMTARALHNHVVDKMELQMQGIPLNISKSENY